MSEDGFLLTQEGELIVIGSVEIEDSEIWTIFHNLSSNKDSFEANLDDHSGYIFSPKKLFIVLNNDHIKFVIFVCSKDDEPGKMGMQSETK